MADKELFGISEQLESGHEKDHVGDSNKMVGDLVSRQAAIDALDVLCQEHRYKIPGKRETYSQYNEAWQDALDRAEGAIFNLPSAQPERKKGEWIPVTNGRGGFECDQCHNYAPSYQDGVEWLSGFCPNCGAKMDEEIEGRKK